MAKILRKAAKIFGASAGINQIGEFGSLALGTPTTTTDPDVIQSGGLSTWTQGWFNAIVGANAPAIEDMNAFCYVAAYQIAYIMQEGVAEWNTTTTYYIGSIVNSAGKLFYSLTDTNLNNAVTNPNFWFQVGGTSLNPQVTSLLAARAVSVWTSENAGDTSTWRDMCWSPELGLYVAVAQVTTGADQVMHSPDGKTWTGAVSASTLSWSGVDWSPELGLFVAVAATGSGGTVQAMFSSDAVTWSTAGVTTVAGLWEAVKWIADFGLFVAVSAGSTNQIMTSPDGKTWTARTTAGTAGGNQWTGIAFSPSLQTIVIVGAGGASAYSNDGITWPASTPIGPGATTWFAVTWAQEIGVFAAVSTVGTSRVMTSRDGILWVAQSASDTSSWSAIDWSSELGQFVAVATATTGTALVMSSPDGVTWTSQTAASVKAWRAVKWSPQLGIFASVANNGGATANMVMISRYVKKFIAT